MKPTLGYTASSNWTSMSPGFGKALTKDEDDDDHGVVLGGLDQQRDQRWPLTLGQVARAQILTIAHVYGHNDFFKNNFTFTSPPMPRRRWRRSRRAADRVRATSRTRRSAASGRGVPRRRARALVQPLAQPGHQQAQAGRAAPAADRCRRPAHDPFARLHKRAGARRSSTCQASRSSPRTTSSCSSATTTAIWRTGSATC